MKVRRATTSAFCCAERRNLKMSSAGWCWPSRRVSRRTRSSGGDPCVDEEEGGRHTPFFNGYRPQFLLPDDGRDGIVTLAAGVEMVMPGDNVTVTGELISPIAMDQVAVQAVREGGQDRRSPLRKFSLGRPGLLAGMAGA